MWSNGVEFLTLPLSRSFHLRMSRCTHAFLTQGFCFANVQLERATVVLGRSQAPKCGIATDQPERGREHANTDTGFTGFESQ
jgi:hypothetical protein